ncbi:MAG: excalibur calcium-binding domain-containing protein [Acidimicrobiales bacterium]
MIGQGPPRPCREQPHAATRQPAPAHPPGRLRLGGRGHDRSGLLRHRLDADNDGIACES